MADNWDPDCPMDLNDDFSPLSPPSEGSGSRFGLEEDMEMLELGLGFRFGFEEDVEMSELGLGFRFGFEEDVEMWELGLGFQFGFEEDVEISELGLGFGIGFEENVEMSELGLGFGIDISDGIGLEDLDSIDGQNSEGWDVSDDAGYDNGDDLHLLLYEALFGEVAEDENLIWGRPPTAKTVLDNLPSVDSKDDNTICAVCIEKISCGTQAKRLPCAHRYHGDCILPWLRTRNTCPLCRFELPTDDPTQ